jgi:hypothetical protein
MFLSVSNDDLKQGDCGQGAGGGGSNQFTRNI